MAGVLLQERARNSSLLYSFQPGSLVRPTSYPTGNLEPSFEVKVRYAIG
jgi:hypothetical protein